MNSVVLGIDDEQDGADREKSTFVDADRSTDDESSKHHMTSVSAVEWDFDGNYDLVTYDDPCDSIAARSFASLGFIYQDGDSGFLSPARPYV